ncbi:MAG TPA: site-specific DNA-methyltransferase, partial [Candidatus Magasanikbacteria bacterium]|nr:site-specific DNA-methyltransferase [Candidatus Magasanikbacteria bacterium]
MEQAKLKQLIFKVLKADERLWNEDKTELNQTLLLDLVENIDEKVIDLLLQEKDLREKFFVKIKDVYVFKTNDFRFFMEENKVDNSYTAYKNRIGLTDGKKFLKDTNDIVLDFPYKDCVLEGGQSTEEGSDTYFEYSEKAEKYEEKQGKRKEIFFNQVLAHDEIDRLFDHKALTNWKRFSKDGEQKVKEIKRDEDGTIKENLIIKGNNLLALHSLKKQFTGKVKLIYIDPPYNTGGATDIFTYNNSFNHSTWLTFMRNRLEAGKQLLKNDGFIAITIDHVELFYLGAVADEIFGKENRVGIVTVYINPKGRQHEKFFSASTEYMLVYANNINVAKFNSITIDEEKSKSFDLDDENGKYRLDKFLRARTSTLRTEKPDFYYPIYVSPDLKEITTTKQKGYFEVFPIENKKEYTWKTKKDTFEERLKEDNFVALKNNGDVQIFNKFREQQVFKNLWTDKKYFPEFQGTNLLKKILGRNAFSYPKSLYAVLD